MTPAAPRLRAGQIANLGYVKRRDGELAVALSAMKLWEARALLAKSRDLLRRLSGP